MAPGTEFFQPETGPQFGGRRPNSENAGAFRVGFQKACSEIPYSTEQGIFAKEQGI
jgi:hypothetical protein